MHGHRNIAIVCNPLAGTGRAVTLAEKLASELGKKGITFELFKEHWPVDFNLFTDVWISGGDGTLNFFINHYRLIKLPLVIFNGGTGNDVHWALYKNKSFEEQLDLVLATEARPVDAGRCNERYFINGVGIGFEGEVARSLTGKKKLPGKTSFLITIIKKIFSYRSVSYSLRTGEASFSNKKHLIIDICNGNRAGGGFFVAPESKIDDGLFDVILVKPLSPFFRLRWLPVIEKGKHLQLPFINFFRTKKIMIDSNKPMQAHLDGEYYESKIFEIEILPGRFLFRY